VLRSLLGVRGAALWRQRITSPAVCVAAASVLIAATQQEPLDRDVLRCPFAFQDFAGLGNSR
jgi:hypothetical protein